MFKLILNHFRKDTFFAAGTFAFIFGAFYGLIWTSGLSGGSIESIFVALLGGLSSGIIAMFIISSIGYFAVERKINTYMIITMLFYLFAIGLCFHYETKGDILMMLVGALLFPLALSPFFLLLSATQISKITHLSNTLSEWFTYGVFIIAFISWVFLEVKQSKNVILITLKYLLVGVMFSILLFGLNGCLSGLS